MKMSLPDIWWLNQLRTHPKTLCTPTRRFEIATSVVPTTGFSDRYFAALLPKETINESFGEAREILDRARIYVTSVTLWVFLSQVLSTHRGCVSAVAKLISCNLIRHVMSEAAREAGVQPWQISFKATMSTLTDILPVLGLIGDPAELCRVLLACCGQHTVGNRPDRYEPRVLKRRSKPYKLMQKPRRAYKPGEA